MTAAKRSDRGFYFGLALASLLWLGGTARAEAAGYWTCSGTTWLAVGEPQHPAPTKPCQSQLEIPNTQAACEQAGGRWGPAGLFPQPICRVPTRDAGRACADERECEGTCLAALTPAQRDIAKQWTSLRQKQQIPGKCTPAVPIFGCMAVVKEGFVTGILCLD